eukprot:TRINITY_DN3437_c0_g1_i1.p1 TRINITY_DN3437_c0_g1~~TRINITY_DN3437_c0_g1_i1.p1  ORF type:complete len:604 (+),score=153.36 TRINITY_DN3437_c0_g1_i1:70-1881(+)
MSYYYGSYNDENDTELSPLNQPWPNFIDPTTVRKEESESESIHPITPKQSSIPNAMLVLNQPNVFERLYSKNNSNVIANLTEQIQNEQNSQLTFQPKSSKDNSPRRSHQAFLKDQERFLSLKQKKIETLKSALVDERDNELTFSPKINDYSENLHRESEVFERLSVKSNKSPKLKLDSPKKISSSIEKRAINRSNHLYNLAIKPKNKPKKFLPKVTINERSSYIITEQRFKVCLECLKEYNDPVESSELTQILIELDLMDDEIDDPLDDFVIAQLMTSLGENDDESRISHSRITSLYAHIIDADEEFFKEKEIEKISFDNPIFADIVKNLKEKFKNHLFKERRKAKTNKNLYTPNKEEKLNASDLFNYTTVGDYKEDPRLNTFNRLYDDGQKKIEKIFRLKEDLKKEKEKECTFSPTLYKSKSTNGVKHTYLELSQSPKRVSKYETFEESEFKKCTFCPKINEKTISPKSKLSLSQQKVIDRLKKAREKKLEEEPKPRYTDETYRKTKALPFKPFELETERRNMQRNTESKPLLYLDVAFGQANKHQRLTIYPDTNPTELAVSFGRIWRLKPNAIEKLKNLIEQQLNNCLNSYSNGIPEVKDF